MDGSTAKLPVRSTVVSLKEPSGPKGRFLTGNMAEMRLDRLEFSMNLALTYGDVSLFKVGPLAIYMVYHPDGVKRILQDNNHNYSKDSPVFALLKPLLGNGLFLSEGEFWLRQRRLMQPMFHRQRIAGFGEVMTNAAERAIEGWHPAAVERRPLDIAREMMRLTLDVACRSLFSIDIQGEAGPIGSAINFLVEDFTFRFDHPFYPPLQVPLPRNRHYHRAIATLDEIVYGMIRQRREQADPPNDLLSLLISVRDEETGEGMTDRQMRDELVTLLIAGHETTANTLTWALYLLSMHPDARQRLEAEVDGALNGRTPTPGDLANLAYTQRVIDETMRLYPPAWITNRQALAEDEICGYRIPKGAMVTISPYVTHRLPEFWDNPEGFDPERFTPEKVKERPAFAYFPFGGGPRMCIGRGFALVEAPLVLAAIAQRCRLDCLPGHEVRKRPLVTLRPDGGLPMTVQYR